MKKLLLTFGIIFAFLAPIGVSLAAGNPAFADAKAEIQKGIQDTGTKTTTSTADVIKNVISVMLYAVGVLAVIIIIYSGIMFVIASGNPNTIQKAKTSIIYAVVGLVVSILAYAIVNFVIDSIK